MAWLELSPPKTNAHAASSPITISTNGANSRFAQWIRVRFQTASLDLPWLAEGKTVKVETGDVDGVQMLRITPKGSFTLTRAPIGKAKAATALHITLPALASTLPDKQPGRAAIFTTAGGGLLIELPGWAVCKPATAPPAAAPVKNSPGTPFKLGAPSHKEVFEQRAGGGRP